MYRKVRGAKNEGKKTVKRRRKGDGGGPFPSVQTPERMRKQLRTTDTQRKKKGESSSKNQKRRSLGKKKGLIINPN